MKRGRTWARCANCAKATWWCARHGCKPAAPRNAAESTRLDAVLAAAATLATDTFDAYSRPSYKNWREVCAALLRRGYSPKVAEAILRSKWTRWAGDASESPHGKHTYADLLRFMDKMPDLRAEVALLAVESFPRYKFDPIEFGPTPKKKPAPTDVRALVEELLRHIPDGANDAADRARARAGKFLAGRTS